MGHVRAASIYQLSADVVAIRMLREFLPVIWSLQAYAMYTQSSRDCHLAEGT